MEHKTYRVLTLPRVVTTREFDDWFEQQHSRTKVKIEARLDRIQEEGYFGWVKKFDGITELKWTSNLRIYLKESNQQVVIVLLGGNKNGQKKDIQKAKKLIEELEGL